MSETQRDISQQRKLTVKDLGNPKKVDADTPRLILGTIIGRIISIKDIVDAKGEAFPALVGTFEGEPADPGKDIVRANLLFLPSGFQEPLIAAYRELQGDDPKKEVSVEFAYEVASVTASNAQGYSYAFRPIFQQAAQDPLLALRGEVKRIVAVKQAAAIAGPAKAPKDKAA